MHLRDSERRSFVTTRRQAFLNRERRHPKRGKPITQGKQTPGTALYTVNADRRIEIENKIPPPRFFCFGKDEQDDLFGKVAIFVPCWGRGWASRGGVVVVAVRPTRKQGKARRAHKN